MSNTKTKNENFRINKDGDVELCTGIKDVFGNLIYENDWIESTEQGERNKIIYDSKKKKLVCINRYGVTFSIENEMSKHTLNNYYFILKDSEMYDIDYKQ